jgi:hypothetical protein
MAPEKSIETFKNFRYKHPIVKLGVDKPSPGGEGFNGKLVVVKKPGTTYKFLLIPNSL